MCIAYFINLWFYDKKNIFRITMHILGFTLLITICFTWRLSHLSCHSKTFIHENINFLTRHIFFRPVIDLHWKIQFIIIKKNLFFN